MTLAYFYSSTTTFTAILVHFRVSEEGMEDFFEGREKTVRVYFDVPECRSLLDIDTEIWAKLLEQTGCSIIG